MNKRRQPFGYQICGGRVAVKCSEADIVKYIFRAYIGGASFNDIKLNLLKQQVSYDGDKAWNKNMIARILGDRRYVGTDVYPQILLCEEFEAAESIRTSKISTDTRSEARRLLYKLSDKRPAAQTEADVLGIINALIHDPSLIKEPKTAPEVTETFELQAELARRSAGKSPSKKNAPTGRSRYSSKYALSDRLYCGECGTRYQRCTWRNRDGSKRIVWRCVSRVDYGNKYCHDSPTLDEEPLHRAILAAINSTVKGKDSIIYNLKSAMEKELAPVAGQQLSLSEIDNQLEQLNAAFSKVLAEASESGDQAAYSDRFRDIMQKQTALKAQRDKIQRMLAESGKATAHIEQCRQAAETTPSAITEWDEALIRQVVESVTVETGSEIIVALKSGASIHQELL